VRSLLDRLNMKLGGKPGKRGEAIKVMLLGMRAVEKRLLIADRGNEKKVYTVSTMKTSSTKSPYAVTSRGQSRKRSEKGKKRRIAKTDARYQKDLALLLGGYRLTDAKK